MRISDLSERSGVPIATIKYYLREGLLPAGERVSATSARYSSAHLRRLQVLRLLRETGDIPVSRLRELVQVASDNSRPPFEVMAAAADALAPVPTPETGPDAAPARALADALIEGAGWLRVRPEAPDRANLAALFEQVLTAWPEGSAESLAGYTEAIDAIASAEIEGLDPSQGTVALLEQMVLGQVIFGEMLLTLRRLAHEHYSAERFA